MPIKFDVSNPRCPSRNVLEAISHKWSILLMRELANETLRFGELKRRLHGISPKMLTQTLNSLESYGFILRREYPVLPLKVEYSLSPLGLELNQLLQALTSWTELNMLRILNKS